MPIYTYQCSAKKCCCITEVIQTLSEAPLTKCPKCKRGKVIKIISLPARPVVPGDPRETILQARAEGKKMAGEIMKGNQEVIADVYGSDVADGKVKTNLPKPKTMSDIKNKKSSVKRSK
jgi:putative FmdB family regulatory protein